MAPKPRLPQTSPSQWLSTKKILDQVHSVWHDICLMSNFGSRTLSLTGYNFHRTVLQFETLVQSSFLPPSFHSELKALPAYSCSLPLSFTNFSHKKSLGYFFLSWHILSNDPSQQILPNSFPKWDKVTLPPAMGASFRFSASITALLFCVFFILSILACVVSHCVFCGIFFPL